MDAFLKGRLYLKRTITMTIFGKPISFIATSNLSESRYFCETLLGFNCLSDEQFALVFALEGATLRIQKIESVQAVNYTVLGWEVGNIKKGVDELTRKGIRFEQHSQLAQDESGIWSAQSGAQVAWFRDPDSNLLSLTET